jgi:hypothetical protein
MKKRKQPTATPATPAQPTPPPKPKRTIAEIMKAEGLKFEDVTEKYLGRAIQIIGAPGKKPGSLARVS